MDVIQKIAGELAVHQKQVTAAVALLDEGATVPLSLVTVRKSQEDWMIFNYVY